MSKATVQKVVRFRQSTTDRATYKPAPPKQYVPPPPVRVPPPSKSPN